MKTSFSHNQLDDVHLADIEVNLRKCVHCGFCQATCPTYVLLGDELDSPRGRIYLIQTMLEKQLKPTSAMVQHVDRCLSCLACMTTCPSGVNYRHLIDHARNYIEQNYQRSFYDRWLRWLLRRTLPYPARLRVILMFARPMARLAPVLRGMNMFAGVVAMLDLVRKKATPAIPERLAINQKMRKSVALFEGCVQPVLKPEINAATQRLLGHFGVEALTIKGEGCCGSLSHHLGHSHEAKIMALRNIKLWLNAFDRENLSALIVTASGCASTIGDYAALFADDAEALNLVKRLEDKMLDISQYLVRLKLPRLPANGFCVAYHAACSLQHGLGEKQAPKTLLTQAGFTVVEPKEAHLCCGSAGVYNITQPVLANQLLERKVSAIESLEPKAIVTGNIGCMAQLERGTAVPVLSLPTLLVWAYCGVKPYQTWPDLAT